MSLSTHELREAPQKALGLLYRDDLPTQRLLSRPAGRPVRHVANDDSLPRTGSCPHRVERRFGSGVRPRTENLSQCVLPSLSRLAKLKRPHSTARSFHSGVTVSPLSYALLHFFFSLFRSSEPFPLLVHPLGQSPRGPVLPSSNVVIAVRTG